MSTKTRLQKLEKEKEKKRSASPVIEEIIIMGTREDGTQYEIERIKVNPVNPEVKHDN